MMQHCVPAVGRRSQSHPTHSGLKRHRGFARGWRTAAWFALLGIAVASLGGCDDSDDGSSPGDGPGLGGGNPPPGTDPAQVIGVSPPRASAAGGTAVTLTTRDFADDFSVSLPGVTLAGVPASDITALDATTLLFRLPALAAGAVDIEVSDSAFSASLTGYAVVAAVAASEVLINEALANPGGLDASRDGTGSNLQDEFVELVNLRTTGVDLSGFGLADASGLRHRFPDPTTLPAGGALVVFGGGGAGVAGVPFAEAHASGHAQLASSGSLSLNNGGDTLTLSDPDGAIVDQLTLGASTAGTSLNRSPEATPGGAPDAHGSLAGALADVYSGGNFSPGLRVDQSAW